MSRNGYGFHFVARGIWELEAVFRSLPIRIRFAFFIAAQSEISRTSGAATATCLLDSNSDSDSDSDSEKSWYAQSESRRSVPPLGARGQRNRSQLFKASKRRLNSNWFHFSFSLPPFFGFCFLANNLKCQFVFIKLKLFIKHRPSHVGSVNS